MVYFAKISTLCSIQIFLLWQYNNYPSNVNLLFLVTKQADKHEVRFVFLTQATKILDIPEDNSTRWFPWNVAKGKQSSGVYCVDIVTLCGLVMQALHNIKTSRYITSCADNFTNAEIKEQEIKEREIKEQEIKDEEVMEHELLNALENLLTRQHHG